MIAEIVSRSNRNKDEKKGKGERKEGGMMKEYGTVQHNI